jgi:hypothetical protein
MTSGHCNRRRPWVWPRTDTPDESSKISSAQRRARASLAISGPGRAYSVARAGRGRTERSSASATAERPGRDRPPTPEAQAALSIHMKLTMRSFRTPFGVRLSHPSQVLGQEAEQHIGPFPAPDSTKHAPRSDAGPGKSFPTRQLGTRRHCLDRLRRAPSRSTSAPGSPAAMVPGLSMSTFLQGALLLDKPAAGS